LAVALLLGIAGFFLAEEMLRLMGADEQVIATGKSYTQIIILGDPAIMLWFMINVILLGAGNAAIAVKSLWLANILNIVLDPLLIFGWGPIPAMGITGAAWATTIGRAVGVSYQLYHLLKGNASVQIGIKNLVFELKTVVNLIKVGSGGMGQFL